MAAAPENVKDPPKRTQEKRERHRVEGIPKMNVSSPRRGFQNPQKIIRRTEAVLQAADFRLVEDGVDDLRKRQVLFGAQEIEDLVVVDESPIGKPNLPAGQDEGNRGRPEYDQQSGQPAAAGKRQLPNLAISLSKNPAKGVVSLNKKCELQGK